MIADQPFVSYKDRKEKKKTRKQMDDLADRWARKKEKEKGISDPLAGFGKSQRTTLNEFFNKK